jgi:hypothetical protein
MTARRALIALAAACLCAGPAGATTFTSRFVGPTRALGDALSQTVARSLPVTSASPGLTFSFDPASGAFVRDTDLLGQLYLERARPIGRGKWNVTVSYQHVHIDAVQGQDLDSLRDNTLPIITGGQTNNPGAPRGNVLLKFPRYDVGLAVDEVTLATTYGITDNLDVNLTLPILVSSLSIDANALTFTRNPNTNGLVPSGRRGNRFSQGATTATGVGDLFLRGKYRAYTNSWLEVAGGLVVRMPTGDANNFQGTGDWELSPLLYLSTRRFPVGGPVELQGFFNGGIDLNIDDVDLSEGRFGAGLDVALGQRATLSIAFLAREPFHGFAPAGFFDVPRYNPRTGCPSAAGCTTHPMGPLFGLESARASYYSLSIGGRVNLWRDTVFGFANVLIPLADEGIHTDPIPLVGFEATF